MTNTTHRFTQIQADALADLLQWDGAPSMPIADRKQAHRELLAAGIIELDGDDLYVTDPAQTAQDILAGMDRGELER